MRCALFPFSWAVLEDFFRVRVSRAPGSTVVPSYCSLADRAGNSRYRDGFRGVFLSTGFGQAVSAIGTAAGR
jgi:hypothetical protein